ncbi:L-fuculokinase [Muricauda sp. SCSIO 64092]|uniref:L-fuculokinase n=1 Tax=Allomuricauda sp. SCSIO 64092 TaxID=2908842 RepID=UPI001FF45611|nr:L-fuculokinase [Muricauda sp. SCSIO 64092]UOY04927.1 L-fuculokinase [Muricauda sp. SCSIO 64092]
MEACVLIFDCGATNLRVVAMAPDGNIKASHSFPNATADDPFFKGGKIWSLEIIWDKLCAASKAVVDQLKDVEIIGVSVTTFGVDGTLVDFEGNLKYPVISWQCNRTHPILKSLDKYIDLYELYEKTGVYPYDFNTIFKLLWFKENHPETLKDSRFLFMPSLLVNLLSGVQVNDATMLGTAMIANLSTQEVSIPLLEKLGIPAALFGTPAQAGEVVGTVTKKASEASGIPVGVPVCLSGHDTQFAVFGSGAGLDEPVLSSGTWEILMCRSKKYSATAQQLDLGITTEFDAEKNMYDLGVNYVASGLLEWVGNHFFQDVPKKQRYQIMVEEAEQVPPGANGVAVDPNFYDPTNDAGGAISGIKLATSRGEIYRASLEALALTLKNALHVLEKAADFKARKIICVGGGSKNSLWNQIKADVCGIPIQLIAQKETTVLGSALFTFTGVGYYKNLKEARSSIDYQPYLVEPSVNKNTYQQLFENKE